jgi:hypothetical protein
MINGDENSRVFVDKMDNKLWVSIHTRCGGAHCEIPMDEAKKMLAALQEFLKEEIAI